MKKHIFALLSFLLLSSAFATEPQGKFECDYKNYKFDNVVINMTPDCNISVSPEWGFETDGRKRSYTFTSAGYLMIFLNTKDYDRLSRSTGSNSYHLIPEKAEENTLEYDFDQSLNLLTFVTASGVKIEVDTKGIQILNIEGYRLTTKPLYHIDQMVKLNGNVDITAYDNNLLFDHGFRRGEVSITQLNRDAFVSLGQSKTCKIKNSDVLKKDPQDASEVIFQLANYQDALKFYNKKC